jgi:NADPH:quinone reductase-like Zn-dependent oxidoreductase
MACWDYDRTRALADGLVRLTGVELTRLDLPMNFAEHGVRFTGIDPADHLPQALPLLADLVARGELEVPVWRTFPLAQAAQAHTEIEAHHNKGKVVLLP